jgi:hypothetical protein
MKSKTGGKALLFRVVSMWKTLAFSSKTLPIRFMEPCMALLGGSMRERVFSRVFGVW